jgi:ceramide glucosyltransferase
VTVVLYVLLALAVLALTIQVLAQLAVFSLVGQGRTGESQRTWGVSVLKPLKGTDPKLEDNLRTILEQDWDKLQIVFGAEAPDDPALAVVRRLVPQYPHVATRIVTLPPRLGLNPKVNLCAELARHAHHDLVIISDSSVVAPKNYVRSLVNCFSLPNTGLVSSPLVGFGAASPGGAVDNLMLNLFILRGVCFTKLFAGHSCVIGKSMMFRLSELERLGGWRPVADVLAEDYVLGRLFRQAGFEVRLCSERLPTRTHCARVKDSVQRHLRWCQMRRRTSAVAYLTELVSNVSVWGSALLVVSLLSGAQLPMVACAALLLASKVAIDLFSVLWLAPQQLSLQLLALIPLAEFLNFWAWAQGAVKRTVEWRGDRFLIGAQTELSQFVEQDDCRASDANARAPHARMLHSAFVRR